MDITKSFQTSECGNINQLTVTGRVLNQVLGIEDVKKKNPDTPIRGKSETSIHRGKRSLQTFKEILNRYQPSNQKKPVAKLLHSYLQDAKSTLKIDNRLSSLKPSRPKQYNYLSLEEIDELLQERKIDPILANLLKSADKLHETPQEAMLPQTLPGSTTWNLSDTVVSTWPVEPKPTLSVQDLKETSMGSVPLAGRIITDKATFTAFGISSKPTSPVSTDELSQELLSAADRMIKKIGVFVDKKSEAPLRKQHTLTGIAPINTILPHMETPPAGTPASDTHAKEHESYIKSKEFLPPQGKVGDTLSHIDLELQPPAGRPVITRASSADPHRPSQQPQLGRPLTPGVYDIQFQPKVGRSLTYGGLPGSTGAPVHPIIGRSLTQGVTEGQLQPTVGIPLTQGAAEGQLQPTVGRSLSQGVPDGQLQPTVGRSLSHGVSEGQLQQTIDGSLPQGPTEDQLQPTVGRSLSQGVTDGQLQPTVGRSLSHGVPVGQLQSTVGRSLSHGLPERPLPPAIGRAMTLGTADFRGRPGTGDSQTKLGKSLTMGADAYGPAHMFSPGDFARVESIQPDDAPTEASPGKIAKTLSSAHLTEDEIKAEKLAKTQSSYASYKQEAEKLKRNIMKPLYSTKDADVPNKFIYKDPKRERSFYGKRKISSKMAHKEQAVPEEKPVAVSYNSKEVKEIVVKGKECPVQVNVGTLSEALDEEEAIKSPPIPDDKQLAKLMVEEVSCTNALEKIWEDYQANNQISKKDSEMDLQTFIERAQETFEEFFVQRRDTTGEVMKTVTFSLKDQPNLTLEQAKRLVQEALVDPQMAHLLMTGKKDDFITKLKLASLTNNLRTAPIPEGEKGLKAITGPTETAELKPTGKDEEGLSPELADGALKPITEESSTKTSQMDVTIKDTEEDVSREKSEDAASQDICSLSEVFRKEAEQPTTGVQITELASDFDSALSQTGICVPDSIATGESMITEETLISEQAATVPTEGDTTASLEGPVPDSTHVSATQDLPTDGLATIETEGIPSEGVIAEGHPIDDMATKIVPTDSTESIHSGSPQQDGEAVPTERVLKKRLSKKSSTKQSHHAKSPTGEPSPSSPTGELAQSPLASLPEGTQEGPKEATPPEGPKEAAPPEGPKEAAPPEGPKEITPPAAPKEITPPAAPKEITPPVSPKEIKPPAAPKEITSPAVLPTKTPPTALKPATPASVSVASKVPPTEIQKVGPSDSAKAPAAKLMDPSAAQSRRPSDSKSKGKDKSKPTQAQPPQKLSVPPVYRTLSAEEVHKVDELLLKYDPATGKPSSTSLFEIPEGPTRRKHSTEDAFLRARHMTERLSKRFESSGPTDDFTPLQKKPKVLSPTKSPLPAIGDQKTPDVPITSPKEDTMVIGKDKEKKISISLPKSEKPPKAEKEPKPKKEPKEKAPKEKGKKEKKEKVAKEKAPKEKVPKEEAPKSQEDGEETEKPVLTKKQSKKKALEKKMSEKQALEKRPSERPLLEKSQSKRERIKKNITVPEDDDLAAIFKDKDEKDKFLEIGIDKLLSMAKEKKQKKHRDIDPNKKQFRDPIEVRDKLHARREQLHMLIMGMSDEKTMELESVSQQELFQELATIEDEEITETLSMLTKVLHFDVEDASASKEPDEAAKEEKQVTEGLTTEEDSQRPTTPQKIPRVPSPAPPAVSVAPSASPLSEPDKLESTPAELPPSRKSSAESQEVTDMPVVSKPVVEMVLPDQSEEGLDESLFRNALLKMKTLNIFNAIKALGIANPQMKDFDEYIAQNKVAEMMDPEELEHLRRAASEMFMFKGKAKKSQRRSIKDPIKSKDVQKLRGLTEPQQGETNEEEYFEPADVARLQKQAILATVKPELELLPFDQRINPPYEFSYYIFCPDPPKPQKQGKNKKK